MECNIMWPVWPRKGGEARDVAFLASRRGGDSKAMTMVLGKPHLNQPTSYQLATYIPWGSPKRRALMMRNPKGCGC